MTVVLNQSKCRLNNLILLRSNPSLLTRLQVGGRSGNICKLKQSKVALQNCCLFQLCYYLHLMDMQGKCRKDCDCRRFMCILVRVGSHHHRSRTQRYCNHLHHKIHRLTNQVLLHHRPKKRMAQSLVLYLVMHSAY